MRKIILIQHCQSGHHINNMSGGWTDTPLTDLGRKQANLIGKKLKNMLSIEEYALREVNTGIAAGKTKDWVRKIKFL